VNSLLPPAVLRDIQGIPRHRRFQGWCLRLMLLALAGCSAPVERDGLPVPIADAARTPDAVPRAEPLSRYGNPPSYVVNGKRYYTRKTSRGYVERGIASWYGTKFHGRRTSSGEPYDMFRMTAAHRSLPLPSYVEVTNLENGRKTIVRVNDRGPFHADRMLDLSYAAAAKLGLLRSGTGQVEIRAVTPGGGRVATSRSEIGVHGNRGISHYVQVGAFRERINAQRLQSRLQIMSGPGVAISARPHEDKHLYRVRVGPFAREETADRWAERLVTLGFQNSHVVSAKGEQYPQKLSETDGADWQSKVHGGSTSLYQVR
jgi:rare lipoprotein A